MNITPAKIITLFFIGTILAGTVLLSLPVSLKNPSDNKLIDSLFTATSAVCVTGLTTVDIGTHYTLLGQIIILILIQIGGLGYMALGSLFMIFFGKLSLKSKIVLQETSDIIPFTNIKEYLKNVISVTLILEFIGGVFLTLFFVKTGLINYSFLKTVYYGFFHSISAFNNAGFSLFSNNLNAFTRNPGILLTVCFLVILGGIGYYVLMDIFYNNFNIKKTTLHTKIVLSTTLFLILAGTVIIYLIEKENPRTIGNYTFGYKLLNSFFHSVIPRTAGFNSINMTDVLPATIIITMALMLIGASPGSTGGGIKTTTLFILLKSMISIIKGSRFTNVYNRRINSDNVRKAFLIFFVFLIFIWASSFLLIIVEKKDIIPLLFETISATSTVGLSLNVTQFLSSFGKLLIIITILAGRVGPLTLGLAILFVEESDEIKYPEEKVMIG